MALILVMPEKMAVPEFPWPCDDGETEVCPITGRARILLYHLMFDPSPFQYMRTEILEGQFSRSTSLYSVLFKK
jgi:hypothetical protein